MIRWAPPAHLVALTSTGPRIANKSKYATESGPSCGSRPDLSPAITIESSSHATRATPARRPQRASRWLRRAAQYSGQHFGERGYDRQPCRQWAAPSATWRGQSLVREKEEHGGKEFTQRGQAAERLSIADGHADD